MSLPDSLQSILQEFSTVASSDRSDFLIEFAESFQQTSRPKPYPEKNRVPGCESEVFLFASVHDGKVEVEAAVLNPQGISAMAWAAILQEGVRGVHPEELAGIPNEIVYEFFGRGLSMGKGQGLMSMVGMVKAMVLEAPDSKV